MPRFVHRRSDPEPTLKNAATSRKGISRRSLGDFNPVRLTIAAPRNYALGDVVRLFPVGKQVSRLCDPAEFVTSGQADLFADPVFLNTRTSRASSSFKEDRAWRLASPSRRGGGRPVPDRWSTRLKGEAASPSRSSRSLKVAVRELEMWRETFLRAGRIEQVRGVPTRGRS